MLQRLRAIFKMPRLQEQHLKRVWLIVGLFAIIVVLDFFTPPPYALGFLYTGPILLASSRLSRSATVQATVMATGLTLLNLFIPKSVTAGSGVGCCFLVKRKLFNARFIRLFGMILAHSF